MPRFTNPYIAGSAIRNQDSFLGRQDILEWVEHELRNPGTNALVLFGQRRVGKTSLLLQIQRVLPATDFVVTYFDLQDQAMRPLGKVLSDLSEAIVDQNNLEIELPDSKTNDETGRVFRTKFLPAIYEKVPEPKRFVVLLDEFDVLDVSSEERLSDNAAAKSLLPFIRRLIADESRLVFIFVAGRRPQDLSINFNQTFKTGLSQEVWVLDSESAARLIKRAEDNKSLSFTDKAVEKILSLTSGHPYLIQLMCQRIWEHAYRSKPNNIPTINDVDVEASLPDVLQAGGQALIWLWEGLSPAERIYAAALAELSWGEKAITEDEVIQILYEHASRLRTREVELAPRELIKRRILEEVNGGYRFAIELFRLWIKQAKNLQDVKDDLDRVDEPALQMYKLGVTFYGVKDWEAAVGSFKDALKRNPKLFQAQLMLGETFFDMGHYDAAVSELEKAFELDRDDSYLALARALIAQAKDVQKKGDIDAAVLISQRATQVSPNDKEARLINNALQMQIKENHAISLVQDRKWTDAISLFNELLDQDLTKDPVKQQEWKQYLEDCKLSDVTDRETEGKSLMEAENWQEAEQIFRYLLEQQLINDLSRQTQWEENISKCARNMTLDKSYDEAKNALAQGQWEDAIKGLAGILVSDPNYKDAGYFLNIAYINKNLDDEKSASKPKTVSKNTKESIKNLKENSAKPRSKRAQAQPELTEATKQSSPTLELKSQHPLSLPETLWKKTWEVVRIIIFIASAAAVIYGVYYSITHTYHQILGLGKWWDYIIVGGWILVIVGGGVGVMMVIYAVLGVFTESIGSQEIKYVDVMGDNLFFLNGKGVIGVMYLPTKQVERVGVEKNINSLFCYSDKRILLSNGDTWNLRTNKKDKYIEMPSHSSLQDVNEITNIALIKTALSLSLIDLKTNKIISSVKMPKGYVKKALLSIDGKWIVGLGQDTTHPYVQIWSINGKLVENTLPEGEGYSSAIAISPDSNVLAFAHGKKLILYSLHANKILCEIGISEPGSENSIEFISNDLLIVGSTDALSLVDLLKGEIIWKQSFSKVLKAHLLDKRGGLLVVSSTPTAQVHHFEIKPTDRLNNSGL